MKKCIAGGVLRAVCCVLWGLAALVPPVAARAETVQQAIAKLTAGTPYAGRVWQEMKPSEVINYNANHRQLVWIQPPPAQFIIVGIYDHPYWLGAYFYPEPGAPYAVDRYVEDEFRANGKWVCGAAGTRELRIFIPQ